MSERPNILFLMSDEHRPDVTGYEGDPVIRTPVLDRLAASGGVFRNAYTPSPICVPGRQALMAGQLPRTAGCEHFGQDLAPGHL
ncbi:MAG: sulfatase-like hydrolase/transferase, partial [Thermomicrobiales bacterium]